jgi:predicted 3-demethylubiquinone-9 3-methyltransferase (glyoxalase superfamily)
MPNITPFLWFDNQAEDAARFYESVFEDSKVTSIMPGPDGKALVVGFTLNGLEVAALNGGPHHKLSEAFSFVVHCDGQEEVDTYWKALSEGGKEIQCGWLTDQFGLSWQIVPKQFFELMQAGTPAQSQAVLGAMMQMIKFDISLLQKAFDDAGA